MKRVGDLLGTPTEPSKARGPGRSRANPQSTTPALTPKRSAVIVRNPPSDDVCPICKGKGFLVYDVPPGDPSFSKVVPCRCTEAKSVSERAQTLQRLSNLGPLSRLIFDTFLPDGVGLPEDLRRSIREAYDSSLAFAKNPKGWLVLLGGYGCGKTHLAAAIANFRVALGHQALFVVVPDLLDHLRATYAPTATIAYDERLESIRETPLLILDDLGAHSGTAWAQEKLYQILNHRYNSQLPTVVTSNQRLEELDPRITSRLVDPDLSQVYEILAPDFRQSGVTGRVGTQLSSLGLYRQQTFETFSDRSGLPFEQYENLRRAVEAARGYAQRPQGWLVFGGSFGCGKTHLAAAIGNYQITSGRSATMFVSVPDLLDHLRATFNPTSTITLDKLFEHVRTVQLLILDDLSMENSTPWAREKLYQLLNHRYVAHLATVITTSLKLDNKLKDGNDDPNTLKVREPRLFNWITDGVRCRFFQITAPSYRGSETQQAAKQSTNKPKN